MAEQEPSVPLHEIPSASQEIAPPAQEAFQIPTESVQSQANSEHSPATMDVTTESADVTAREIGCSGHEGVCGPNCSCHNEEANAEADSFFAELGNTNEAQDHIEPINVEKSTEDANMVAQSIGEHTPGVCQCAACQRSTSEASAEADDFFANIGNETIKDTVDPATQIIDYSERPQSASFNNQAPDEHQHAVFEQLQNDAPASEIVGEPDEPQFITKADIKEASDHTPIDIQEEVAAAEIQPTAAAARSAATEDKSTPLIEPLQPVAVTERLDQPSIDTMVDEPTPSPELPPVSIVTEIAPAIIKDIATPTLFGSDTKSTEIETTEITLPTIIDIQPTLEASPSEPEPIESELPPLASTIDHKPPAVTEVVELSPTTVSLLESVPQLIVASETMEQPVYEKAAALIDTLITRIEIASSEAMPLSQEDMAHLITIAETLQIQPKVLFDALKIERENPYLTVEAMEIMRALRELQNPDVRKEFITHTKTTVTTIDTQISLSQKLGYLILSLFHSPFQARRVQSALS